jgi:hypothetical protein
LWLKGDEGVVTNSLGQINRWIDQSGNGNDASQTNSLQQPTLINEAGGSNGYPALSFNGIQDPTNGDCLEGVGDLALSNAYTSFLVYKEGDPGTAFDRALAVLGVPGEYGGDRAYLLRQGSMWFSAWGLDWGAAMTPIVGTTRLWTMRASTNLLAIEQFDTEGTSSNYSSISTAGYTLNPPSPGYYIGGLGSQVRNYNGSIAELIYFKGSLTEADRQAVQGYFTEKYFTTGSTNGLTYQWFLNGTNIPGATGATLDLANLQLTNSGSYTVEVSNSAGTVLSSNAVLDIGNPPVVTTQPETQEAVAGTNVTFAVSVSGTAPLSYQWFFGGAAVTNATNSTFTLTDVQLGSSGAYKVAISSPYGSTVSSNATLSVDVPPFIYTQPQSQAVATGGDVTLRVGSGLPQVTSGTLALWLDAGSGVIKDTNGFVTRWKDQSGNTNDATQPNPAQQPTVANAAGLNGAPVVRFNGLHDGINGSYLHGTGDVGLSNALTSFTVYMATNADVQGFTWMVGQPPNFGTIRGDAFLHNDTTFSTWGIGYEAPFPVPTNVYSIWNDRVDTNLSRVEMFQTLPTSSTNFSFNMSGAGGVAPGYYIGGIDPNIEYSQPYYNLPGDIAEIVLYRGSLTEVDRLSVLHYLQGKYFGATYAGGSATFSYQWQFDGTNIAGGTNSTLTITNVQSANAGTYTVILTDLAGTITSSNAVVTVGDAPGFSAQPVSQSIVAGSPVTFSATATGAGTDSFQWAFDGAAIASATNSSFTLTNVSTNSSGLYAVTVTSPYGSAVSSNALLTVLVPKLQLGSVATTGGTTITVPVQLVAVGTEAGLGFSLDFDPSILTFVSAELGSSALGSVILVNSNQAASGRLGLAIDLTSALAQGTNEVGEVHFRVAVLTNTATTTISFGGQPTALEVSDGFGTPIASDFVGGNVSITRAVVEGDVWPAPTGDGQVNISDWIQEGRFVAGLDTTTNAGELQRADSAPRSTGGDGQITVEDWVQVGRYAAGLDPLTAVGYPPEQNTTRKAPSKTSAPRTIAIIPMTQGGLTNSVAVQLNAQGGENSLGFSVSFDPAAARFVGASLGSGATSAVLFQNTTQAIKGRLGFVLGYNLQSAPTSFTAGERQVVRLNFASASYSNNIALTFSDSPVKCDLVDLSANSLPAAYQNAILSIGGISWPTLKASQSENQVQLSWPIVSGFVLESSTSLDGGWTPVGAGPSTNGTSLNFTMPISSGQRFYRLRQQ